MEGSPEGRAFCEAINSMVCGGCGHDVMVGGVIVYM